MEGFFYLLDVVFVIWLLVLVRRNDKDPEAMKTAQLGIFSMAQPSDKPASNKPTKGKY